MYVCMYVWKYSDSVFPTRYGSSVAENSPSSDGESAK